jgi:predicted RNA binding protein YcfA (HicA-like mRNA interferase family)
VATLRPFRLFLVVHTQGETLEGTERNVKEAIALYLESLADHGKRSRGRAIVPGKGDRSRACSRLIHGQTPVSAVRKVVGALKRSGFVEDRQEGSHLILIHPETKIRTVVPCSSRSGDQATSTAPSFRMRTSRPTSS